MLRTVLASVFAPTRQPVVCECRRCGAGVDTPADDCPYCGPNGEIVSDELE